MTAKTTNRVRLSDVRAAIARIESARSVAWDATFGVLFFNSSTDVDAEAANREVARLEADFATAYGSLDYWTTLLRQV